MKPKRPADAYINLIKLKKYATEQGITLHDAINELYTDFTNNLEEAEPKDPLYVDAVDFISTFQLVTVSLFQRKFSINFDRALHIINQLETTHYLARDKERKYRVLQERFKQ